MQLKEHQYLTRRYKWDSAYTKNCARLGNLVENPIFLRM